MYRHSKTFSEACIGKPLQSKMPDRIRWVGEWCRMIVTARSSSLACTSQQTQMWRTLYYYLPIPLGQLHKWHAIVGHLLTIVPGSKSDRAIICPARMQLSSTSSFVPFTYEYGHTYIHERILEIRLRTRMTQTVSYIEVLFLYEYCVLSKRDEQTVECIVVQLNKMLNCNLTLQIVLDLI